MIFSGFEQALNEQYWVIGREVMVAATGCYDVGMTFPWLVIKVTMRFDSMLPGGSGLSSTVGIFGESQRSTELRYSMGRLTFKLSPHSVCGTLATIFWIPMLFDALSSYTMSDLMQGQNNPQSWWGE